MSVAFTEEQLAERRTGLGASEVASALGLNPYKPPFVLWAQKTGKIPDDDINEAMEMGVLLEPVVVELYTRRVAPAVRWSEGTIRCPFSSILFATPDAERIGEPIGIECKAPVAGAWMDPDRWGDDGTDNAPVEYIVQAQMQMAAVPQWTRVDIAALIGRQFRHYPIARHPKLIGQLIERAERWWRDYVLADVMPSPDASEASREALLSMFPREASNEFAPWTDEALALATELAAIRSRRGADKKRETEICNRLMPMIGDRVGFDDGERRLTWKAHAKGTPKYAQLVKTLNVPADVIAQHMSAPKRPITLRGFGNEAEGDE